MLFNTKYFPKNFDQFIGNDKAVQMVKNFLKDYNIPNIILVGDHGIGKNTLCSLLLREYFGEDYEYFSFNIYGSINRGKDIITEYSEKKKKVDSSESTNISSFINKTLRLPENKCRIIVIYDFDCMTESAQLVLKAIIEEKSHRVRFIFICNDISNISDALQSRATPIQMFKLNKEDVRKRLKEIVEIENSTNVYKKYVSDEIYDIIYLLTEGDLKCAINYLQIYMNSDDVKIENKIDNKILIDNFYNIFNITPLYIIKNMIMSKNILKSCKDLKMLLDNGFNSQDILDMILKLLKSNENIINENIKIIHLNTLIDVSKKYIHSPSHIHLFNMVCKFVQHNM